jgi:cell division transport system permease protein
MLNAIGHVLIFAWQSFWRNIWLSLVTITIVVLALVSINILVVLNVIIDKSITIIQDKVDVSIYFQPGTTESQVQEAQTYLSALPEVQEISYISAQDNLVQFREKHRYDQVILDSLDELSENPLTATLVIKARTVSEYQNIIDQFDASRYSGLAMKKNFADHQLSIARIQSISNSVNKVGIIVSILFVLISVLIVFNTIRIAIYTHQQEINIMKLVGAANWFIRGPFLLESIMYGIIASIITVGLLYPLLRLIQPYVFSFFGAQFDIMAYFQENVAALVVTQLLVILVLTILSSYIAIRRYLKG